MPLQLFNTLTRRKERFRPVRGRTLRIYTCGPTVYDFAHIGNFRAYLVADLLVRLLRSRGYRVRWVVNITDIDDKTLSRAHASGVSLKEVTARFENAFFKDWQTLGLLKPTVTPRATEHLAEMAALVRRLVEKKFAYLADDGIYFDISRFKGYGKLSGLEPGQTKPGARVAVDEYSKEDLADFVLWKRLEPRYRNVWQPPTTDLQSLVPWPGRPGWHIECSALSRRYLGQPFNIKTGGADLIFPHHENEIAQSTAAFGKRYARFFIHNELLLVEGRKMSKREGNIITVRSLLKEGIDPRALRLALLVAHYRDKLNFTRASLASAAEMITWLTETAMRTAEAKGAGRLALPQEEVATFRQARRAIVTALEDDLATPKAFAELSAAARTINRILDATGERLPASLAREFRSFWKEIEELFGLPFRPAEHPRLSADERRLIEEREEARRRGDFGRADVIRHKLRQYGILIEDTPRGPRVKRVSPSS